MVAEVWAPIAGYEGFYEVSSHGRVRSVERTIEFVTAGGSVQRRRGPSVIRRPRANASGYLFVSLCRDGKSQITSVAQIVAETFIGPRPPRHDICHNDGNSANNGVLNLRYDTRRGNCRDKRAHGTENIGERNPRARLTAAQVDAIRNARRSESARVLGAEYGVSAGHIKNIRCDRCWRD